MKVQRLLKQDVKYYNFTYLSFPNKSPPLQKEPFCDKMTKWKTIVVFSLG